MSKLSDVIASIRDRFPDMEETAVLLSVLAQREQEIAELRADIATMNTRLHERTQAFLAAEVRHLQTIRSLQKP